MPANDEAKAGLQFVRDFYRGSSGYADHIAPERLSLIHLKTRLDSAIIDAFFGSAKPSNSEMKIWSGHRFDNEPRKVLISIGTQKTSSFRIGRPTLQKNMQAGIEMIPNYVRFEKKDAANIFLKIDFDMYLLLSEAERGVPVLFLESDLVKKVWRFIEQLQSFNGIEEDIVNINLLDIQNKKRIDVMIDREDKKYLSVNSSRTEEA